MDIGVYLCVASQIHGVKSSDSLSEIKNMDEMFVLSYCAVCLFFLPVLYTASSLHCETVHSCL